MNTRERRYYEKFNTSKLICSNYDRDLSMVEKEALLCIENTNLDWAMQTNDKDNITDFIYEVNSYKELIEVSNKILSGNAELVNYAKHRWLNSLASKISEELFCSYNLVKKEPNHKRHGVDFYICGVPFDLKVTKFPENIKSMNSEEAKLRKNELIHWLYESQSRGKRYSVVHNRIFIMVLTDDPFEAFINKFNFTKIKKLVDIYLKQVVSNLRSNKVPFNTVELNLKNTPKTDFSPGGDFRGEVFGDILFLDLD